MSKAISSIEPVEAALGTPASRRDIAAALAAAGDALELPKACVDHLVLFFRTNDPVYKDLFIAERLAPFTSQEKPPEDFWEPQRASLAHGDAARVSAALRNGLAPASLALLESELRDLGKTLATPVDKSLNILFFADCLSRDIRYGLIAPSLRDGIWINQFLLFNKDPAAQRNALRDLANKKIDAVFYSPFTYGFFPAYEQLLTWRSATLGRAKIRQRVDGIMKEVAAVIDLLADLFECPIFIHTTANARRHDSTFPNRVINVATGRTRRIARERANHAILEQIEKKNKATFRHLHCIDEMEFLRRHGEWELGRRLYNANSDQPIGTLAKWFAPPYHDILRVLADMQTRKLVICDLDNTLWEGIIGEGAVRHYADRQAILQRLRKKGILLAINSKNDPKNVKWDGAVLTLDDFVCAQINWSPKVANVRNIKDALNLKPKDFIFIDDRADERGMVGEGFPDVLCLDATDGRVWRLLDQWEKILPEQDETDRTEFYRQRESRQKYLDSLPKEDEGALFATLGLKVTIRPAKKGDLKRVVELINRTNQFNLCGSRTTLKEASEWASDPDYHILVVDADDKFGSMGTVSIAIFHKTPAALEIPIFVLSCRVFGYRIEDAVVDAAKGVAAKHHLPVVGRYAETPHNAPCRKVYPDNKFQWKADAWHYQGPGGRTTPPWLAVTLQDVPQA